MTTPFALASFAWKGRLTLTLLSPAYPESGMTVPFALADFSCNADITLIFFLQTLFAVASVIPFAEVTENSNISSFELTIQPPPRCKSEFGLTLPE